MNGKLQDKIHIYVAKTCGFSPRNLLPAAASHYPYPGKQISMKAGWSAPLSSLCVHLLMISPILFSAIYA